jgi:hypothetical protein
VSEDVRMARKQIVDRLADHIADENGWGKADFVTALENAEQAIDFLIADCSLFPSDRWDEQCHRCEKPIGEHLVDGRCLEGPFRTEDILDGPVAFEAGSLWWRRDDD